MARYLLKFGKTENLKYISHLDLLRLFQRGFKRADIRLRYSRGFNPHPRIGFAHPLSLGFESIGEYMEFETDEDYADETVVERLTANMPTALKVYGCRRLAEISKTSAAAALEYASYLAVFRGKAEERELIDSSIKRYMAQEEIVITRFSKKRGMDIQADIRPDIHSVTSVMGADRLTLSAMLKAGSMGNLNPETLVESVCGFCGCGYDRKLWSFMRTEMFFSENKRNLLPLSEFKG